MIVKAGQSGFRDGIRAGVGFGYAIVDVAGVRVGHRTLHEGERLRTA
jgi:L-aminopeptidase/D-esterase-like protein